MSVLLETETVEDETTPKLFEDNRDVLWSFPTLELVFSMSVELELLETTTGEDTTANDEVTKELSEDNTGNTEGL